MGRTSRWMMQGTLLLLAVARPALARADLDDSVSVADDPTVIALAVALACSEPPGETAPAAAPSAAATPAAVVEVVATVRARTLAFDEVPRADAVLPAGAKVAWRAERVNLPLHPTAGVVYRDVEVRLTISAPEATLAAMLAQARRVATGIRIAEVGATTETETRSKTETTTTARPDVARVTDEQATPR